MIGDPWSAQIGQTGGDCKSSRRGVAFRRALRRTPGGDRQSLLWRAEAVLGIQREPLLAQPEEAMTVPDPDRFGAEDVLLDIEPRNRRELLEILAAAAAPRCHVGEEAILEALLAREALGSTALGRGIAMPHAQITGAGSPAVLLARLRRPIDFEARDDEPVDLAILLVWPAEMRAGLLGRMGGIAQGLRDPVLLRRLRRAGTAEEVAALLNDATARPEATGDPDRN